MSNRASSIKSGLAWIVVSPIALLMALISTVESLNVYYVQIFCFGAWSAFGVVSGIARIVGAPWTNRLQSILSWIGFIYFSGAGLVMALYSIVALFERGIAVGALSLLISIMVALTGLPFFLMARKHSSNA
ncbi:MAG: hypothetical protein WA435_06670 [Gallionellaceae bacterium]